MSTEKESDMKNRAEDKSDGSMENVISFPKTAKLTAPKEDHFKLVQFHIKESELAMLRNLSIEKMKPLGQIIKELLKKHGADIEKYIPPNMRD